MPEIRFECDQDELSILDGYCAATGKHRTEVFKELLRIWSKDKLHEATLVLRFVGSNPDGSESSRK
jgi:hypothetical protein